MTLRRWRRREKLPVIHEDNLVPLLTKLGLYEAVLAGELRCSFCETTVTVGNLRGLYRHGESIKLFCDSPECIWAGLNPENST